MPAWTNPMPLPEANSYYILFFTLAFPVNICFSIMVCPSCPYFTFYPEKTKTSLNWKIPTASLSQSVYLFHVHLLIFLFVQHFRLKAPFKLVNCCQEAKSAEKQILSCSYCLLFWYCHFLVPFSRPVLKGVGPTAIWGCCLEPTTFLCAKKPKQRKNLSRFSDHIEVVWLLKSKAWPNGRCFFKRGHRRHFLNTQPVLSTK